MKAGAARRAGGGAVAGGMGYSRGGEGPPSLLAVGREDGLDVQEGRAVQGLQGGDVEASFGGDRQDRDAVQPDGVGAVRRAGREDPAWRLARVPAAADLQGLPAGQVKPRQKENLGAGQDSLQSRGKAGSISSQASGAPSRPCRGASSRVFSADRTIPMGRTSMGEGFGTGSAPFRGSGPRAGARRCRGLRAGDRCTAGENGERERSCIPP